MRKLIFASLLAIAGLSLCPNQIKAQATEDNTIYSFVSVETPPTYPGGIQNFYKFLGDHIKYPQEAKDKKVQGNVFVSFVVEKDGSVMDLKVEKGLGYGTDEEALRILKSSTRWNPGIKNGTPVRVKYNIPIKFVLPV